MLKTCIYYYSFMNDFMQLLLYVEEEHTQAALECLERGFDDFYDEECAYCFGDCVEYRLSELNIPYIIEYPEYDEEDGDPTDEWYEHVEEVTNSKTYNVVTQNYQEDQEHEKVHTKRIAKHGSPGNG